MKTLDDFHDGMRVRFRSEAIGPTFKRGGGYNGQPPKQVWRGTVIRVSPPPGAGVVWVQWDCLDKGKHCPVQPDSLLRENARALAL